MTRTEINRNVKILNTFKLLNEWIEQGNEIYNEGERILKFENIPFDDYVKLTPKEFRGMFKSYRFNYKISDTMFRQISYQSLMTKKIYWR